MRPLSISKSHYSIRLIFLLIAGIFFGNCASSSAGMATSNVPIIDRKYKVVGSVEKQKGWITMDFIIFAFPLDKPPVNYLVKTSLEEHDADALINIRYWTDRSNFLFLIYNRMGITAEAISFEDGEKGKKKKKGKK